uniref:Uncharacterized protein n=2 Tax=Parascaris univalens TaxID=6257 RepID=A0A914ZXP5_PARUN
MKWNQRKSQLDDSSHHSRSLHSLKRRHFACFIHCAHDGLVKFIFRYKMNLTKGNEPVVICCLGRAGCLQFCCSADPFILKCGVQLIGSLKWSAISSRTVRPHVSHLTLFKVHHVWYDIIHWWHLSF